MWEGSACTVHVQVEDAAQTSAAVLGPVDSSLALGDCRPGLLSAGVGVIDELIRRVKERDYEVLLDPMAAVISGGEWPRLYQGPRDLAMALATADVSPDEGGEAQPQALILWGWPCSADQMTSMHVLDFRRDGTDRDSWRRLIASQAFMVTVTNDSLSLSIDCESLAPALQWVQGALAGRVERIRHL